VYNSWIHFTGIAMDYETIAKYVFANEHVPWELHDSKKRDRELVISRQISIYIQNSLHPEDTWVALGSMFKKDHATAMHAVKNIKDLMFSDVELRARILVYSQYINDQEKIRKETEIKNILAFKNVETLNTLLAMIDKMELIAKVYCDITNSKIVKV